MPLFINQGFNFYNFFRKRFRHVQDERLHSAIARGDFSECAALVQDGVDVDARDALGLAPLHLAAGAARLDLCTLLLKTGASPVALDHAHRFPVDIAREVNPEFANLFEYQCLLALLELIPSNQCVERAEMEEKCRAKLAEIQETSNVS